MTNPQDALVLQNQYGEVSENAVLSGSGEGLPIAAHTVLMNNTGSSALATGVAVQSVANALPSKAGITAINAEAAAMAITIALSTSNTYTDAAVNTAVNAALVTVVSDINAAITQINAILAALKVVS